MCRPGSGEFERERRFLACGMASGFAVPKNAVHKTGDVKPGPEKGKAGIFPHLFNLQFNSF